MCFERLSESCLRLKSIYLNSLAMLNKQDDIIMRDFAIRAKLDEDVTCIYTEFLKSVEDDPDGGKQFRDLYCKWYDGDKAVRGIIDETLVHVCGYSMKTLVKKALQRPCSACSAYHGGDAEGCDHCRIFRFCKGRWWMDN
jgi:hypothetical protein